MLNYTAVIFEQAGASLKPTVAAIIVGVIQILGNYASTMLVERLGRKILLIVSAVGISLSQGVMATYSYCQIKGHQVESFSWVPVVAFSFMIFVAALGLMSLPFLVISELMPQRLRSTANMILMSVLWVISTCTIKV